MFSRKKDLLKDGETFVSKQIRELRLETLDHQGRTWSVGEYVDSMVYAEGRFETGVASKGALRIYKVNCQGEESYAVLRILYVGEDEAKVYLIAMEKMLNDATMRFQTKAMEIIEMFDASDQDKELIKSKLREN
ncbi:MAG: hypothetical protein KGH54_01500 [Candidatus Micrarchaeota archaeon]|nr:hypothetical protein [Candidatus Micrarchaeota archaeon]